jgi:hypothetical protein
MDSNSLNSIDSDNDDSVINDMNETDFNFNTVQTKKFSYKCLPFIYYQYYEDVKELENSNKIILPQKILDNLSLMRNLVFPLHFKINNSEILFTPSDFRQDINEIYISNHFLENLSLNIDESVELTYLNYPIEKGSKIKLKPHTSNFLEIMDQKQYLEENLVKLYTTLTIGQTILIPYFENIILIDVIDCSPNKTISIIDTDLEVDFEQPWDYKEPEKPKINEKLENKKQNLNQNSFKKGRLRFNQNIPPKQNQENSVNDNSVNKNKNSVGFVPFSGVGRKLGN